MDSATPASIPKRAPLKWYWRGLRVLLLAYIGILIFLYVFQRKLIFPGAGTHGDSASKVTAPPDCELLSLKTAGNINVKALFGPAFGPDGKIESTPKTRPTILFCYGNAMCLHTAMQQFNAFRHMGANVIIPEYTGYGLSDGEASESGCYAAADAAYDHLLTRSDVDPSKIIIAGWSLGGAVAIDLASRKPAAGLASFSSFTSMAGMGHNLYPFLPTFAISAILNHRFESISKIQNVPCPVLIGHGTADPMIPYRMSDQLAAAATSPVTRLTVDGAGHEDFFSHDGAKVSAAFGEFIEKCCGK